MKYRFEVTQTIYKYIDIEAQDEDEAYEEVPAKKSTFSKATNKAKDFLSNVFPFED